MRILITNDDGINSPLLKILANALKNYADEILVVAPTVEMSATSHKLTLREGMEVLKYADIVEGIPSYSVNGTPADCVKIGLNLLEFKPDYIFSGINNGYNVESMYIDIADGVLDGNNTLYIAFYGAQGQLTDLKSVTELPSDKTVPLNFFLEEDGHIKVMCFQPQLQPMFNVVQFFE